MKYEQAIKEIQKLQQSDSEEILENEMQNDYQFGSIMKIEQEEVTPVTRYEPITFKEEFVEPKFEIFEIYSNETFEFEDNFPSTSQSRPFLCDVCGKGFKGKVDIRMHVRNHFRYKDYKCDIKNCNKVFRTKQYLNFHQETHIEGKSFTCPICLKQFKNKHLLKKHHKYTHETTRKFQCLKCKKVFKTIAQLKTHEKIHDDSMDFECDICTKKFKVYSYLRIHRKRHAANKQFKCSTCKKGFTVKEDLTQHEKCHSDKLYFGCELCDKQFKWRQCLKSHLLKYHS